MSIDVLLDIGLGACALAVAHSQRAMVISMRSLLEHLTARVDTHESRLDALEQPAEETRVAGFTGEPL